RFFVYSVSEREHVIMDREDRRENEVTVLTSHLLNPKFNLAEWYSQKVSELRGLDPQKVRKWRRKELGTKMPMETPLAARVEQLL
ncbi:uncharacterized protein HD556DRAFT_1204188, partial [Suillus plorans]